MIKNSADILEAFVRHNLRFLDGLFIIDNNSSDDTRSILDALIAEGLPVRCYDDPEFAYYQSARMTKFCDFVNELSAPDFIIPIDDDEFVKCDSRSVLEDALLSLHEDEYGISPWQTYVPNASVNPSGNPLVHITRRRRVESPQYFKVWIPKALVLSDGFLIEQGNHSIALGNGPPAAHRILPRVAIAHFPVRAPSQIVSKAVLGWLSYLARGDTHLHEYGYHWRTLYERLLKNEDVTWEDASEIALNYARSDEMPRLTQSDCLEDPIEADALRYTPKALPTPFVSVVREFERMISQQNHGA